MIAAAAVTVAPALGGCTEAEPRTLHLTLRLDPTMPAYDHIQVSIGGWAGGYQLSEEIFDLVEADLAPDGTYQTVLFINKHAESVDVLAEVHSGALVIGHGRRTVLTMENKTYDLEVEVVPHPANSY